MSSPQSPMHPAGASAPEPEPEKGTRQAPAPEHASDVSEQHVEPHPTQSTHNPFRVSHPPVPDAQQPPQEKARSTEHERPKSGPSSSTPHPPEDPTAYRDLEKKLPEDTKNDPAAPSQMPEPALPAPEGKPGHVVVDFAPPESDLDEKAPPPEFTPYEAEYFEDDDGDIISHDHHLNEDGEALYRFLLSHAARPPTFILHCSGTHTETRTRRVTRTVGDRRETYNETYTVTITDFDFEIDATNHIVTGPVNWSVGDEEPTYRGLMVRQIDLPTGRRKATAEEKGDHKSWLQDRYARGRPPWVGRQGGWKDGSEENPITLKSSRTARQWADDYCSSPKYLKEFSYQKVIHGWNIEALEESVRMAIVQTQYGGSIHVGFNYTGTKILIRSDNTLSRLLSKTWVKFLFWVFLIYPFIWLFKRYSSRGGGRWEVCGGAYALKHLEPLGIDCPLAEGDVRNPATLPTPRIIDTDDGPRRLIGIREGEWFKKWEEVIKRSAATRLKTGQPMRDVGDGPLAPAHALDGYDDST